jgi:hypothetical protein
MADSTNGNHTIRIGYLVSESTPFRAGAINLAVQQAMLNGILTEFNIRYASHQDLHRLHSKYLKSDISSFVVDYCCFKYFLALRTVFSF